MGPRPALLLLLLLSASTQASEVVAGPPEDVSVTFYRSPDRSAGALELDDLGGFALVSETRTVTLPPGESRLRFDGVADGLDPATALLSGLPDGLMEKNRDARLLSPGALMDAAVGTRVLLQRTDARTGRLSRVEARIDSDAEGVVFQTVDGLEALRCSGLPETFEFSGISGLSASPTLSVLVRTPAARTARVTLSYLARGFDWAANYVAIISPDTHQLELGAWVTLANGNGSGFDRAHVQVVAGRVQRDSGAVEPVELDAPVLAQCWPRGSTSDAPAGPVQVLRMLTPAAAPVPARLEEMVMAKNAGTARLMQQEQLGDLKLYRVPDRTAVNSRQVKQVRLLDKYSIPVQILYGGEIFPDRQMAPFAARRMLRTLNDEANHLGLPLPSGEVQAFEHTERGDLLLAESPLSDLAVGEEVELGLGDSADVQIAQSCDEKVPAHTNCITVSNARHADATVEIRLRLPPGAHVVSSDRPVSFRHDVPGFDLRVAAGHSERIRYVTSRPGAASAP